jgi:hypothetical protein
MSHAVLEKVVLPEETEEEEEEGRDLKFVQVVLSA